MTTLPRLTVSDLIASLNQTLEYAYPAIEVEGEVASFKINQQKYIFFDLKDVSGSVNCFMTTWQLRVPIEDGMKVVVRATPKIMPWGKFSLTIQTIRPSGEGSLKKSFELLRTKLEKEGLFDAERKRHLPAMPSRIAVISSTQAAGYSDFMRIISERWGGLAIDVAHVQVQGEGAADQIIRALRHINQRVELSEVIVIVRGGGSADDLSTFNDEQLVCEIAASRIPTLVGVGHEVDETLADRAADVRAATPSHAAYIVVPDKNELIDDAQRLVAHAAILTGQSIDKAASDSQLLLGRIVERIDDWISDAAGVLQQYKSMLAVFNPESVLRRGYAIVRGEEVLGVRLTIEKADTIIEAEVMHVQAK